MTPDQIISGMWGLWTLSWIIAAAWAAPAARRPRLGSSILYYALTFIGISMMFGAGPIHSAALLWPVPPALGYAMVALAAAGFAFTWWARIHLGRLWSANVGAKADHHIVDTGPYALVRHPIYTGLIAATAATAIVRPWGSTVAGALVFSSSFFVKALLEESFLRQELGAEAYDSYRRRVPMLIPFLPAHL